MQPALPFTPDHVQRILDTFNRGLVVRHYERTTFTSADAAAAIGCHLGQIGKSMCVMAAGEPVLVVAAGDRRLDEAKLARYLGVGRKKIKIATPDECVEVFGYAPGGVAPVGLRTPGIPVLIDESLSRWDTVHVAAGTSNDNVTLSLEDLLLVTQGTVTACTRKYAQP